MKHSPGNCITPFLSNMNAQQAHRIQTLVATKPGWDGQTAQAMSAMTWVTFITVLGGLPSACLEKASFTLSPDGYLEMQLGDDRDTTIYFEHDMILVTNDGGEHRPLYTGEEVRRLIFQLMGGSHE